MGQNKLIKGAFAVKRQIITSISTYKQNELIQSAKHKETRKRESIKWGIK